MDPDALLALQGMFNQHKAIILNTLCDLINRTEADPILSPQDRMRKIRDMAHQAAEMIQKMNNTLTVLTH